MITGVAQARGTTSQDDPELYDVILNVSSHGIHNPSSRHAFKSQKIYLIPTQCYICSSTIYPLSSAARCIRCGYYVHRSCCSTQNANLFCRGWTSADLDTNIADDNHQNTDPPEDQEFTSHTTAQIPSSVHLSQPSTAPLTPRLVSLLHLPACLDSSMPQAGTPHCIWKRSLQEISKDFYLTRMANVSTKLHVLEKIVNRLLSDASTFPGRVFKDIRDVYMYLKFTEDTDYLTHAREALDNISCAVVSILPVEIGDDVDSLKMIVTVVDWRVLRQNDGSMYDKVFGAAKRLATRADNALLARLYQQQEREQQEVDDRRKAQMSMTPRQREEHQHQQHQHQQQQDPEKMSVKRLADLKADVPHYEAIHTKLGKIPGEYAVMDKLERLVETLKLIASSAPPAKDSESCGHSSDYSSSGGGGIVETETEMTLEETMQNHDVDADSLMQKFCRILSYETLKYEFYWNAESVFVDHMCQEYTWLLGAEGYALASLQQALVSLCPSGAGVKKNRRNAGKSGMSLCSSSKDSRDDDVRSRYSSRDEDDGRSDPLGVSVHNNEILDCSSHKMKGIAMSGAVAVPGSE